MERPIEQPMKRVIKWPILKAWETYPSLANYILHPLPIRADREKMCSGSVAIGTLVNIWLPNSRVFVFA